MTGQPLEEWLMIAALLLLLFVYARLSGPQRSNGGVRAALGLIGACSFIFGTLLFTILLLVVVTRIPLRLAPTTLTLVEGIAFTYGGLVALASAHDGKFKLVK